VKKDAGMLDAFGKGASEDIRAAKAELYAQMTWDPAAGHSLGAPPAATTPAPSPPPSPKLSFAANGADAAATAAAAAAGGDAGETHPSDRAWGGALK
jgi:inositol hexakisphosphate/diphosphoinositol-pentakisphosphate kinase